MRPAHHTLFRDQVSTLVEWFSHWNDCERTIALYTLLMRISTIQAKFLSLILEHTYREDSYEVQVMQKRANDKDFVRNLMYETKEAAVKKLLTHLPLLNPRNDEARYEYLHLLPKILHHSVEHSVHQEECRQLLSLAVVHPAFPPEERNTLHHWLSQLDRSLGFQERQQATNFMTENPDVRPNTGCENLVRQNYRRRMNGWRNQQPLVHGDSGFGGSFESPPTHLSVSPSPRKARSNSLTPPPPGKGRESSLDDHVGKKEIENRPGRSQSFPVDPQTVASIGLWLKHHRLHKYTSLFSNLTYEDMLNLTSEILETKDITTGARKKILLNINKISDRGEILSRLEKDVLVPGKLEEVLSALKELIVMPLKPFDPPLPEASAQASHHSKACTQILVTRVNELECCNFYIQLLDSALNLEAYTPAHKARFQSWRKECLKLVKQLRWHSHDNHPRGWYHHSGDSSGLPAGSGGHNSGDSSGGAAGPSAGSGGPGSHYRGSSRYSANNHSSQLRTSNSAESQMQHKPRLVRAHAVVGRTKSLPIEPTQPPRVALPPQLSADRENIDAGLESLCISVTEHALSDSKEDCVGYSSYYKQ
ncbi:Protein Smaug-like protein 1 [Acropora cervicornis]|uniref:Protein Smaug-like protein 1 n=1 Tax=Acropora cervicornis TaxID=6130 RepID=A0AAD9VAZ4_ACRCE|nr:Protein Smaug-like protein 1 [Acropora cervicornis]